MLLFRMIGIDIIDIMRSITAIEIAKADLLMPKTAGSKIMHCGATKAAATHKPSRPERIILAIFSSLVI